VPGTGSLLQTIKRLLEKADIIRICWINKTRRLLTVNCLIKKTMKKSILHIKLVNRPLSRSCNTQNRPNGLWLNNRTECLIKVKTRLLSESAGDPTSLVTRQRAI